jgi:hypothetical protein
LGGCNHIVGIAAVIGKARRLYVAACEEIYTPTRLAVTTLTSVPADAYSLSGLPFIDIFAHCIYYTCDLMARNPWVLNARE